jgi:hypothetical protein
MSLFDKLRAALSGGGSPADSGKDQLQFAVRCRRCGEVLTGKVNLQNDLSQDYERDVYFVRKLVSGSGANRCFEQIEVQFTFDASKHLVEREVAGGVFVDPPTVSSELG